VSEFCLELTQPLALFLGTLAVCDVGEKTIPSDDPSVHIARRHGPSQQPPIFAVHTTKARLGFERLANRKGCPPLIRIGLAISRVDSVRPA
jgi:hypothetical protein